MGATNVTYDMSKYMLLILLLRVYALHHKPMLSRAS